MSEIVTTDLLISLSILNNFTHTATLQAPFVCNAFKILCSSPVFIRTSLAKTNIVYEIGLDGTINRNIDSIASNIDKNQFISTPSALPVSAVTINLIQPSPINNNNVYDITIKLYYI